MAAILPSALLAEFSVCHADEAPVQEAPDPLTFDKDILPIFKTRCFDCHAGAQPKADLNLTSRDGLLKGGRSGAAIRLGAAEFSLLWEKIAANEMPAVGEPLTADQKATVRAWINSGAGSEGVEGDAVSGGAQIDPDDRDFWSFLPPVRPAVPTVQGADAARNTIDAFVLAELEANGLALSPEASLRTLARRAYFDLVGLPPTPEEMQAFLADDDDQAYERLIERLLASPRYGERWGRHWLDVAGYADSAGVLSEDRPLPLAWRYRDYVIRAFNADKPYDRFLQEQLAGDELLDYWTAYEQTPALADEVVEGLVATGYLRMAADSSRPDFDTIKNADAQYYYPTLNDTLQIVASSTLGLTLQCARCHSHMFDPIPHEDYYRVQAVFMSAFRPKQWIPQMNRRLKQASKVQQEAANVRNAEIDAQIALLRQELEGLRAEYKSRLFEDRLAQLPETIRDDVRRALAAAADARTAVEQYLAGKFQAELSPDDAALASLLPETYPEFRQAENDHNERIAAHERQRVVFEEIRAAYDLPGEAVTPLLRRGDPLTPGPAVTPGVPRVISAPEPFDWTPPPAGAKTSQRRLAFARWLTQPGHPLTARVMVNRIWLQHFGEGIVSTPEDFGRAGSAPSHPELLDWLATEFVAGGWSVKRVHRLILNSATYRQASTLDPARQADAQRIDPDDRLLWRQRMRRLESEPLRDALLSVAGSLNPELFGRPIPMEAHPDGEVTPLTGADGTRRAIYLQVLRGNPLSMLQAFDQPTMETNCVRRRQSTVSTQALTLMNSEFMVNAAQAFADRVLRESPADPAGRAVWLAFARPPSIDEQALLNEFVESQTGQYAQAASADPSNASEPSDARRRAVADMCHILLGANEFAYVD